MDGTPYLYTLTLSCPDEEWPAFGEGFRHSQATFRLLPVGKVCPLRPAWERGHARGSWHCSLLLACCKTLAAVCVLRLMLVMFLWVAACLQLGPNQAHAYFHSSTDSGCMMFVPACRQDYVPPDKDPWRFF